MISAQPDPISVIIPVHNGERFLGEAIESVLAQRRPAGEIIVVDDGSTDRSAEIIRRFPPPVHYHRQQNQGPASARNAGVALSRGDVIAFLDADDIWLPDKLSLQMEQLRRAPLAIVLCRFHPVFQQDGDWMNPVKRLYFESDPICSMPSGLVLRRSLWQAIGPFHPGYWTSEDTEWFIRSRKLGIAESLVDQVLVHKRIHEGNLTTNAPNSLLFRGLRSSLNRSKR